MYLGTLQCKWHDDLSRTLQTRLLRRVGTVAAREWNDQGVGISLWGLQRMGKELLLLITQLKAISLLIYNAPTL